MINPKEKRLDESFLENWDWTKNKLTTAGFEPRKSHPLKVIPRLPLWGCIVNLGVIPGYCFWLAPLNKSIDKIRRLQHWVRCNVAESEKGLHINLEVVGDNSIVASLTDDNTPNRMKTISSSKIWMHTYLHWGGTLLQWNGGRPYLSEF